MNATITASRRNAADARPARLIATGRPTSASSWSASTDNVGVTGYNVHRSTSAGFTPSAANRIAQPTGTSYADTVAAGTYYYKVAAEDAAGNVGPASTRRARRSATRRRRPRPGR